jgi:hypothetical protein
MELGAKFPNLSLPASPSASASPPRTPSSATICTLLGTHPAFLLYPPPPPQPSRRTLLSRVSRHTITMPHSLYLFPPFAPSPLLSPFDPIGAETRVGQLEEATWPMGPHCGEVPKKKRQCHLICFLTNQTPPSSSPSASSSTSSPTVPYPCASSPSAPSSDVVPLNRREETLPLVRSTRSLTTVVADFANDGGPGFRGTSKLIPFNRVITIDQLK